MSLTNTWLPVALLISSPIAYPAFADSGDEVAKQLNTYYSSTPTACDAGGPAYLCSGLMLRGTKHSPDYKVWNPSPLSQNSGGVSFSYIRTDAKYDRLGLRNYNGYILKPYDSLTANEYKPKVLCAFPIDAWTDTRTQGGCADNPDTGEEEKICTLAGITSASDWLANFNSFKTSPDHLYARKRVCGYDVRQTLGSAAASDFNTVLKSMALLGDKSFRRQNELRIATWEKDLHDTFPIMAFIYTKESGRASAKLDQQDLDKASAGKRWAPVIQVKMPSKKDQEVQFIYNKDDQAIPSTPSTACTQYIENAEWKSTWIRELKANKPQLVITPSTCARGMPASELDNAFMELKKYKTAEWPDARDASMKSQLRCLRDMYEDNPTWNIEPFRPLRNANATNDARCNPWRGSDEVIASEPIEEAPSKPSIGTQVAAALNKRYADTSMSCNGKAALYCSGVLARVVEFSNQFHAWDPSPRSRTSGATSMSYLRSDIGIRKMGWSYKNGYSQGLIFKTLDAAASDQNYALNPLCFYATDGATWFRDGIGCGAHSSYPKESVRCADQETDTYEKYSKHFTTPKTQSHRHDGQCSVEIEAQPFAWAIQVRVDNLVGDSATLHNELIVRTWPLNAANNLPIEAIYYQTDREAAGGLAQALGIQKDFQKTTGRYVPIVRMDLSGTTEAIFSYNSKDER